MFCPICKSKDTAYFAKKDTYTFYRCSSCKSIFLKTLPSASKLNLFYSKQFLYSPGLSNELVIRKRSKTILKRIKKMLPLARTLCDVGSGLGYFLDEARKSGYDTVGIEPSKRLADYAATHLKITPYVGELKKYIDTKHAKFDIVTCIHVIEHVDNPKEFISLLLQLVKPGGILYIETPNSDSHLLYVEKEQYTFLIPPEHLWLLSRHSIKKILPKNTSIEYVNTYSYSEHFMGIIKQIIKRKNSIKQLEGKSSNKIIVNNLPTLKQQASYFFFDCLIAPLFTRVLNLYHKGSILELYIEKRCDKSGL